MAVDQEVVVFGHLVIQAARGGVVALRLPVDAAGSGLLGGLVNGLNQRPANAALAQGGVGVEVLQVAHMRYAAGAEVKEVVCHAHDVFTVLGDQCKHGLLRVEDAFPCFGGDGGV